jgi:hypothetical protein
MLSFRVVSAQNGYHDDADQVLARQPGPFERAPKCRLREAVLCTIAVWRGGGCREVYRMLMGQHGCCGCWWAVFSTFSL